MAKLHPFAIFAALALATAFIACTTENADNGGSHGPVTGTGGAGTEIACDPLAAKDITLGQVVGVGKDAAGTLYVDSPNGIFVSAGGKLIRQYVMGSGQSGSNEFLFTFVSPGGDVSSARNLLVETSGPTASAMALGPTDSKAFLDESPAGVTMLTLVDEAALTGMALVNTPNEIEYLADVSNGDVLLATRPMNEDTTSPNGGLAIFYGPPSAIAQRVITLFQESVSSTGTVTFLVDGTPYVLAFGMVPAPDAGPFGVFALQSLTPQGGAPLGVSLRSPTPKAMPSDLSFTCLP